MIELILMLGQLFILGLVALFHFLVSFNLGNLPEVDEMNSITDVHPWFVTVEAILCLTVLYMGIHI